MNPYLKSRLDSIQGVAFGGVSCDSAQHYAIKDAMQDIRSWGDGAEPDRTLQMALNAIEDFFKGTRTRQLTEPIRICVLYEDCDEKTYRFETAFAKLEKYINSTHSFSGSD